ncbi:EAL domain-containing protein [Telmatospirillum sp.]|uniref:EAL domain-containing protein n=1 Tax=Telmatospirillum sp. TaxID=2079197 RepID=UPI00284F66A8|nr:EAL domain-containing protein [Telmatospirillum sp.]MDR3437749.1 EAL domain-containing protein [Telmatospirillum sp.]
MPASASTVQWVQYSVGQTPDIICVCRRGKIDYINPAGARLLGYEAPCDLIGQPFSRFLHPDFVALFEDGPRDEGPSGLSHPLTFIANDGGKLRANIAVQRFADDSGQALLLHARLLRPEKPFDVIPTVPGLAELMAVCLVDCPDALGGAGGPFDVPHLGSGRPSDVVACSLSAVLPTDALEQMQPVNDGASTKMISSTVVGRDGRQRNVALTVFPLRKRDQASFLVEMREAAEIKMVNDRLRLAAAIFETTAEAIVVLDQAFLITAVNPAFSTITGFSPLEVVGKHPAFFGVAAGSDMLRSILETIRQYGRWDQEQWSLRKSGEEFAKRLSIVGIEGPDGTIGQYVAVFADVTQRKHDEERILYQANFDSLTGLPNRSLLMDRLCQSLLLAERIGQRVGLMYIDLDGFKLVNDTLGHEVGDELLKEAAKRLLFCVRHGDTVARLGGDEFSIIMPNLGEIRFAPVIAQRMIEALEQPFLLNGREAFISASIGITVFPEDATDSHTLLKNADAAMYRAKEQGKANYQFFTADINAEVSERLIIKNGLSKALDRDEFTVYYQPKCDLATGRLTGVEALLRWRNDDMGMVSPVKFIPVMEETGLIGIVGEWVLETACQQYRFWRDTGHPQMRVAVNLSVRQLRQPDLPRIVEGALKRAGIEPSGIELEITESMIMRDTENAVDVLRTLSEMGIRLAMDDFGTGYSSLSYLKRFPVHTIKIDRSFINDIATDPDDQEIIRTIISMGHSLRRKIVAEGVETEEQRVLLRKLRCDEMQGYLLSPPVPAAEIDHLLASVWHGMES